MRPLTSCLWENQINGKIQEKPSQNYFHSVMLQISQNVWFVLISAIGQLIVNTRSWSLKKVCVCCFNCSFAVATEYLMSEDHILSCNNTNTYNMNMTTQSRKYNIPQKKDMLNCYIMKNGHWNVLSKLPLETLYQSVRNLPFGDCFLR